MNKIDQKFTELKEKQQTALIPFISVGDPNIATTIDIIRTLEAAGADIIELGVPYSDPLADGPVIQRASERALKHHITLEDSIKLGRSLREAGVTIPLIIFTYFNPLLQLGMNRFFDLLQANDISGIIVPDLPIEEDAEVRALAEQYNIHFIPLVAPTSNERVIKITKQARGFIYCVSSLGVTGERADFHASIDEFLTLVRNSTDVPIAVGFGISTHEQVVRFSEKCDGVIVGSAIVRTIESNISLLEDDNTKQQGLDNIKQFVSQLKG